MREGQQEQRQKIAKFRADVSCCFLPLALTSTALTQMHDQLASAVAANKRLRGQLEQRRKAALERSRKAGARTAQLAQPRQLGQGQGQAKPARRVRPFDDLTNCPLVFDRRACRCARFHRTARLAVVAGRVWFRASSSRTTRCPSSLDRCLLPSASCVLALPAFCCPAGSCPVEPDALRCMVGRAWRRRTRSP